MNYYVRVKNGDELDGMIVEATSVKVAEGRVLDAFGGGWRVDGKTTEVPTVTAEEAE